MNIDEIRQLISIAEESGLRKLSYKDSSFEVSIDRGNAQEAYSYQPAPAQVYSAPVAEISAEQVQEEPAYAPQSIFVKSPMVATFYSASGPDIPAYVRVGDRVSAGQTVCILESLKVMNEVTADFDCEIEAVLVSNGQRVEYGQPIFRIRRL